MTNKKTETCIEPFFLGPKSENEIWVREKFESILDHWFQWRKSLFVEDPAGILPTQMESEAYKNIRDKMSHHLDFLNTLLLAESPTYSPRYIGHMVSEVSLPALLGHFSALLHNPNNTSAEVSKVGARLENEAIEMLLELVGYDTKLGTGHFTSGGTIANFESLWRARFRMDHWLSLALFLKEKHGRDLNIFADALMGWQNFYELSKTFKVDHHELRQYSLAADNPWKVAGMIARHGPKNFAGPIVLVPGNKHFSWQKGCNIFGFGEEALWSIPLNDQGQLDTTELKNKIELAYQSCRPILMVVSVAGTTETGEIDPVDRVQDLLDQFKTEKGWDIWHHVDAAFGGFMCSLVHHPEIANPVLNSQQFRSLKAISRSHSVTMDPHKLGYVPYSCGAILFPNAQNYAVSQFKAPYLYREDFDHSKWSSTMEGSRTASGAAATWLTGKAIGFTAPDFAKIIANTFHAHQNFKAELTRRCSWLRVLQASDTNIFCFSIANENETLSESNKKTMAIFEKIAASKTFAVSKTVLHFDEYKKLIDSHVKSFAGKANDSRLVLIRCVFMNPFWCNPNVGMALRSQFADELCEYYNELKVTEI